MTLGGRVSESNAKKLLARQLGEFANNLEGVSFLDVKTGKINSKILVMQELLLTSISAWAHEVHSSS